jgi:hypothetical protein
LNIQNTTQFSSTPLILPAKGSVSALQRKATTHLPRGAQGQLIDAAILAENWGHPIKLQTTIRTEKLAGSSAGVFTGKHQADGVACLLELMRKWHVKRGIPWACIWSREVGTDVGGHLHVGTHQSGEHTEDFIDQMAGWTGESRVFLEKHSPDEIGISKNRSWLVQCCTRKGQSGPDLAAYLGKDEPSHILTGWRVKRDNTSKRVLAHPCTGGLVEGTTGAAYRHGTSKGIAPSTAMGRKALETIGDEQRLIRPDLSWLPY